MKGLSPPDSALPECTVTVRAGVTDWRRSPYGNPTVHWHLECTAHTSQEI
jgi:hypothetical protein